MTVSSPNILSTPDLYECYAPYAVIQRRLRTACDTHSVYISSEELVSAIKASSGIPIPADISDYLCDMLSGKVKGPTGRKPDDQERRFIKILAACLYHTYLPWLQQRKKRYKTLDNVDALRKADWWQGPPSERAARMVIKRLGKSAQFDWRHVVNLAYS